MDAVDRIELSLCKEGVVQLERSLYRFWIILFFFQEVDHLEGFVNVWNLFFEASTSLSCVELHELVLGHGLLKLFQCWLDILIRPTEVFLHIGLQCDQPKMWR